MQKRKCEIGKMRKTKLRNEKKYKREKNEKKRIREKI